MAECDFLKFQNLKNISQMSKTFFYVLHFGYVFTFFNVFFIFQTFFLSKKTLAKFRAANRLTRSTFKITAMKQTYDFSVAC